jgi:hypothetical protein
LGPRKKCNSTECSGELRVRRQNFERTGRLGKGTMDILKKYFDGAKRTYRKKYQCERKRGFKLQLKTKAQEK